MSDLFLRSVKLKDFRTFGEFEADVVPAPGLTLLVGTNGLGKSSFFDALEWGLTGEVRRFKSYLPKDDDGKHLTRRGAAARSHAVTLGFNTEGGEITRGAKTLLPPSSIIALLKKPEWTADIQDISTYLAFTHFLGQAAQQRFTSRARNEQWESLKGPSGIDRLDEVRAGLRGRSTELAFNRRERRETELIAQASVTASTLGCSGSIVTTIEYRPIFSALTGCGRSLGRRRVDSAPSPPRKTWPASSGASAPARPTSTAAAFKRSQRFCNVWSLGVGAAVSIP